MRNERRGRPRRAALAAVGALLLAATPAWGWGRVGHRASARLAESRLGPEARAAVRALLDEGESLADASTWPDEIRRDRPETGPWHYVNVPITAERYDPAACPPAGCVVSKIADVRRVLADPAAPEAARREALRWLVHLVQDLHQPVHVGDRGDRGGNDLQLRYREAGTNLHRLWDSGLIEHHSTDEAAWARELDALATPECAAAWAGGTVEDWATESLIAARDAYRDPATGAELRPGATISDVYAEAALPVARERLARSAVRLAALLNAIFPEAPTSP